MRSRPLRSGRLRWDGLHRTRGTGCARRGRPRLRVHYAPAPDYARGRTEQTVTPEFIESHSLSDPKNRLYLYASLPLGKIARREEIVLERDEFFLLSHNEKVIPVDIEREKLEYCRTLVY